MEYALNEHSSKNAVLTDVKSQLLILDRVVHVMDIYFCQMPQKNVKLFKKILESFHRKPRWRRWEIL